MATGPRSVAVELNAVLVALNFLGHLSGVAAATATLVEALRGHKARICGTRKTMPGLRALQKYAVGAGGGANHRFGLDDAVLIKDNHIAAAGGVAAAIRAARAGVGHMVKIEVEIDRLQQLEEALAKAVRHIDWRAATEASGRITPGSAPAIAASGSTQVLDIGLDWRRVSARAVRSAA
jgi:nicotinate-nucleotide pyrophosphorylase (carboxylating)